MAALIFLFIQNIIKLVKLIFSFPIIIYTREFFKSQGKPLGDPLSDLTALDVHPGVTKKIEDPETDPSKQPGFLPLNPPKDGAKLKLYQGLILRYEARLCNPLRKNEKINSSLTETQKMKRNPSAGILLCKLLGMC